MAQRKSTVSYTPKRAVFIPCKRVNKAKHYLSIKSNVLETVEVGRTDAKRVTYSPLDKVSSL